MKITTDDSKNKHYLNHQYQFGRDTMGPVIGQYLVKLHAYLTGFSENNNARILFVSRAGIRIRKSLESLCKATDRSMPENYSDFWVSRLMIAKGVWRRSRGESIDLIQGEFLNSSIRELALSMFRHEETPEKFDWDNSELDQAGVNFRVFINSGSHNALLLNAYFDSQSALFEAYLKDLSSGYKQICLVDTGWQGTIQRLLTNAYPEIDWWGAYFGKYGFESSNRSCWGKMAGMAFEQDHFDPEKPQTAVIHHRHLIEDLFEPAGRSIESLAKLTNGSIFAPDSIKILNEVIELESDPLFTGVLDYLDELSERGGIAEVEREGQKAWGEAARFITTPTREEALIFQNVRRSADFGKEMNVGLLLEPKDRHIDDTPENRINDSLWKPAQVALEYPSEIAVPLQRKLTGLGKMVYGKAENLQKSNKSNQSKNRTKVAVITRTMDRPMFLKRAIASVANQSFSDYVHVVVNDGGDIDKTIATILAVNCDHSKLVLVDNVENRGMEAASNIAIAAVDSEYIIIHDDDDTWDCQFLEETVAFLDDSANSIYKGVITKTTYVSEEVTPKGIKIHGTAPYQDWVENVHIMEMAIGNFLAPIAFLFSREVYDEVGGYDERYPVLGDWDFNLRFLLEGDIGVLGKPLANYHHRDVGDTKLFGNSVISGRDKHLEYSAIVRNKFARNLLHSDHPAMASLVGFGLHFGGSRDSLQAINHKLDQLSVSTKTPSPQPEIQVSAPGLTEEYWVALSNLASAVESNDREVLKKINGNVQGKRFSLLAKKRTGNLNQELLTDLQIKSLASLKGKNYPCIIPPPDFDDAKYRSFYPDVEDGISRGDFNTGYEHYYYYGRFENRARPSV